MVPVRRLWFWTPLAVAVAAIVIAALVTHARPPPAGPAATPAALKAAEATGWTDGVKWVHDSHGEAVPLPSDPLMPRCED